MPSPEDVNVVVVDSRDLRRGWRAQVTRPIVGAALGVVGVIFIIVGYWGVAHETLVAKQIPYLVSGGIGGMVLVAVGAFLLGTDDVRRQLERVEHLELMVTDLHDTLLQARGTAAAAPSAAAVETAAAPSESPVPVVPQPIISAQARNGIGDDRAVVALPRGRSYHLAGCTMVAGKQSEPVDSSIVAERGLTPCPLCDPEPALVAY